MIGVGNEFRRDDGAGLAVLDRLRELLCDRSCGQGPDRVREGQSGQACAGIPGWLRLVASDGEPASLIDAWRGMELAIVVDAVRAEPVVPGAVRRLELDWRAGAGVGRAASSRGAGVSRATSSHGLGVGEAIRLARVLNLLPGRLIVQGIEADDTIFGIGMNKAVIAATEEVTSAILEDLGLSPGIR